MYRVLAGLSIAALVLLAGLGLWQSSDAQRVCSAYPPGTYTFLWCPILYSWTEQSIHALGVVAGAVALVAAAQKNAWKSFVPLLMLLVFYVLETRSFVTSVGCAFAFPACYSRLDLGSNLITADRLLVLLLPLTTLVYALVALRPRHVTVDDLEVSSLDESS